MVQAFDYGKRAHAAMSDDLERQNSRLRAQGENERAPYLNGCVHRPVVGTMASARMR